MKKIWKQAEEPHMREPTVGVGYQAGGATWACGMNHVQQEVRYSGIFLAFSGCEVVQVALFWLASKVFRERLSDDTSVPYLLEDLALSYWHKAGNDCQMFVLVINAIKGNIKYFLGTEGLRVDICLKPKQDPP